MFRALNLAELVLAVATVVGLAIGQPGWGTSVVAVVPVLLLLIQLLAIRPRLTRRSDAVIAGMDAPRSTAHHGYIAAELVKVVMLAVAGALLLAR